MIDKSIDKQIDKQIAKYTYIQTDNFELVEAILLMKAEHCY